MRLLYRIPYRESNGWRPNLPNFFLSEVRTPDFATKSPGSLDLDSDLRQVPQKLF